MTTPADTARLADKIEALAQKYQEAWDYIRAIPRDCQIPFDKMMELESAERAITRACMDKSTTIVAALRELDAAHAREAKLREALEPFANSLVAQTNVEHHSQDWREETDDTVVSITTSHQRKGMPYLAPDHTLWVGAFRRARAALGGEG